MRIIEQIVDYLFEQGTLSAEDEQYLADGGYIRARLARPGRGPCRCQRGRRRERVARPQRSARGARFGTEAERGVPASAARQSSATPDGTDHRRY